MKYADVAENVGQLLDAMPSQDKFIYELLKNYKNLDYIACWFLKGAQYIQKLNCKCAFVSTNSICQGEQVALLWPHIFKKGLEIGFAHKSFKWSNNVKGSAAVICVIIGLRNIANMRGLVLVFSVVG